jgi:hypothetical protein
MSESQPPSGIELAQILEPWFPVFAVVHQAAMRDQLAAVPILGLPRKTERANDLHRAIRNNFRRMCDLADPLLRLEEEPDGSGLDYLVCSMTDTPFAIRWGRFHKSTIHRNDTLRSRSYQEQGGLFGVLPGETTGEMQTITIGHTIEDDFTEAGRPQWWVGKLLLLKERPDESEVITTIHVYSRPARDRLRRERP